MPSDRRYLDFVLGELKEIHGITGKSMFGGFGIFHEGTMFALIYDDTLYFKVDDSNRRDYLEQDSTQFQKMPYFQVPEETIDNHAALTNWARQSIKIAHLSKR